ncbi:hypothetical protein [Paenibacillus sp. NFR01]|uniref:hypothetical protein n=1 Tax=Paenibacillus sp. NFR01 TaxID=1566279 RepID=UPI0008B818E1|nr:hypothetical protein [Paenibacillus sp. NFR01]SET11800.1 hypothetical protein SAMN03159358_0768 [Paenibacillus sp. NFR01]
MNDVPRIVGLMCTVLVVLYAARKITFRLELIRSSQEIGALPYEDSAIYKAAQAFASGRPADEVKQGLSGSYQLNPGDAERIIAAALPNRADVDGGYGAFLQAVNDVLGGDVYQRTLFRES